MTQEATTEATMEATEIKGLVHRVAQILRHGNTIMVMNVDCETIEAGQTKTTNRTLYAAFADNANRTTYLPTALVKANDRISFTLHDDSPWIEKLEITSNI